MANNDKTGFCVPYTVRVTPDKGRGVFASAPICKGTIIWRHVRGQYAVYDERSLKEFLAKLPNSEVIYELTHMFGVPEFPGFMIRVHDDGVLINHSYQPTAVMNSCAAGEAISYDSSPQDVKDVTLALLNVRFSLIATQDVKVGDELTLDYDIGIEDPMYYNTLCEQYDVSWPFK